MRWWDKASFSRHSIQFKLVIGVFIIVLPLLALLHYYNFYTVKVVHEQVGNSNQGMMSLYMSGVDDGLESVNQYIYNLATSNYDLQVMNQPRDEDEFVLAKMRVSNKLENDSLMYTSVVNSIFVYSTERNSLAATLSEATSSEYAAVVNYMEQELFASTTAHQTGALPAPEQDTVSNEQQAISTVEQHTLPVNWFAKKLGDDYYLLRIHPVGKLWVGAWVNMKTLQKPLALIQLGDDGSSLFVTAEGEPMTNAGYVAEHGLQLKALGQQQYKTGAKGKYQVTTEASRNGDFGLAIVVSDHTILQNLPYLNGIVISITFVGVLLIPLVFMYLRKTVLMPLSKIIHAMKRVGDGSMQTRIEPFPTSEEFSLVNRIFNQMVEQIQALKISVYEEQLSKQKAELQHLQSQINPHFFMNTLNLIYSLALDKDYELIKEMTMRLVKYFRYMFRSNLTFVPLKDELEHVRNYLAIHELRYQRALSCHIEVEDALLQTMVPPLIVQTFVDNALKHGAANDQPFALHIVIRSDETADDPGMIIEIRDHGQGFAEHLLPLLNKGERIVDEQGEQHIGTWNVWHRLRILYGERSYIHYANELPHGAKVEFRLPFHPI